MSEHGLPEKIARSVVLDAIVKVVAGISVPLIVFALGWIGHLGDAVNRQATDIALLQQAATESTRRLDAYDKQYAQMLDTLNQLALDMATTKRDAGYLRDWVEELKRNARIGPSG